MEREQRVHKSLNCHIATSVDDLPPRSLVRPMTPVVVKYCKGCRNTFVATNPANLRHFVARQIMESSLHMFIAELNVSLDSSLDQLFATSRASIMRSMLKQHSEGS